MLSCIYSDSPFIFHIFAALTALRHAKSIGHKKVKKNVNGLCVRQARDYQTQIAFGNHGFRAQVTFTLGRFFGQNVTQVSVLVLKTTS